MMPELDFLSQLSPTEVAELVNAELDRCMEEPYRDEWWDSDALGETPREMLARGGYKKLWLYAQATCDPSEVDLTSIEHEQD